MKEWTIWVARSLVNGIGLG